MKLLYEELTYRIRAVLYSVHNQLGPVHKETVYQRALEKEFKAQNIPYKSQPALEVRYRGSRVGAYRPDFSVDDRVILEIKSLPSLPETFSKQLDYYLKTTGYRLGLLVNFGSNRLQVRRRIYGW
jgi:GxxExxY protein